MRQIICAYIGISFFVGMFATYEWSESKDSTGRWRRAQRAAQIALTCWAWPLWLFAYLGFLARDLFESAVGR